MLFVGNLEINQSVKSTNTMEWFPLCFKQSSLFIVAVPQISVSQQPDPGANYTGPREVLLEFVILVF